MDLSLYLIAFPPWSPGLITDPTIHPRGPVYKLFRLGQGPGPECFLGCGPRAVTWAFLSAEDEVDMLNDGQDSEEKISVPSCYGGIGAPVGRQGERRGLRAVGPPCFIAAGAALEMG